MDGSGINVHCAAIGDCQSFGLDSPRCLHLQGAVLACDRDGLEFYVAGAGCCGFLVGQDGCGTTVFNGQGLVRCGHAAVCRFQLPNHAVNHNVAIQAGVALVDVNIGILNDDLLHILVQELHFLGLDVQRLVLRTDGAFAAGRDDGGFLLCYHTGSLGVIIAIEQRAVGVIDTDLYIFSGGNVLDRIVGAAFHCRNQLCCRCVHHDHRAIGTGLDIGGVAVFVIGGKFHECDFFQVVLRRSLVNPKFNISLCLGIKVGNRDHAVLDLNVPLGNRRPVVFSVCGIVESTVIPPIAGVADFVDVVGNVVCQPFQGDVLSFKNSNLRALVQRRRNLIEDTQGLRFRHGVAGFCAVEQALMVHYIDMVLAVHIDGLAVFVDTGQVFAYRQLAQFFRNKLCGGVDLAVKLGGKVLLDIDDQAALGQVHGLGDLVGIAAVHHGVCRKLGCVQADICDFSGKGDGIARTSKPQHQNLRILLCAMPGGIDEVLPGVYVEPHRF